MNLTKLTLGLLLIMAAGIATAQSVTLSSIQVGASPKSTKDSVTYIVTASASALQQGERVIVLAGSAENAGDVSRVTYSVNYKNGKYYLHPGYIWLNGTTITASFTFTTQQLRRVKYLTLYIDKSGTLLSNKLYYKMPQ